MRVRDLWSDPGIFVGRGSRYFWSEPELVKKSSDPDPGVLSEPDPDIFFRNRNFFFKLGSEIFFHRIGSGFGFSLKVLSRRYFLKQSEKVAISQTLKLL